MRATNLIAALALLALSVGVLSGTRDLPYWSDFAPGSAFAAFWVAAIGIVLAVALSVATFMQGSDEPHSFPDRRGMARVLSLSAGLWLTVLLIPLLGFIPAGIAFCLFLLLGIERRPLMPSLFTTVLVTGLVYGVFIAWLGIALPRGALGI